MALARISKVAQATIGRILREETTATIDTVADLAEAYSLDAWQLLIVGMDPENPPALQPLTTAERQLYERLKTTALAIAQAEHIPPSAKGKRS